MVPAQLLPALYGLPAADFHHVASGSNGYAARPGYDLATGRGTPVANKVIAGLVSYRAPAAASSTTAKAGTVSGSAKPCLDFTDVSPRCFRYDGHRASDRSIGRRVDLAKYRSRPFRKPDRGTGAIGKRRLRIGRFQLVLAYVVYPFIEPD